MKYTRCLGCGIGRYSMKRDDEKKKRWWWECCCRKVEKMPVGCRMNRVRDGPGCASCDRHPGEPEQHEAYKSSLRAS